MSRDPMDILLFRERIRGATRMLPENAAPDHITDEIRAEVIHQISLYVKQNAITRHQLGKAINYSATAISEVLSGTYKADDRQIIIELDAWLDQDIRRRAAPRTTQFVWTSVAREIELVANSTVELGTIGLVYGPETSGIGKTMALKAIHANTPGSVLISCEAMGSNPTGLLRAIARGLGINDGQANRALYDRIKSKFSSDREDEAGTRLLIVDQIHKLRYAKNDKPLFILSDLHDTTGAPQLWAGTTDMADYLLREQRKRDETLAQLRSRIGIQRDLLQRSRGPEDGGKGEPLFTVEDIRKVYAANKMRITPDAARFLCKLANVPDGGALRACTNLVRIATKMATNKQLKEINGDLLKSAMQFSIATGKAQRLQHEMDNEQARIAKVG